MGFSLMRKLKDNFLTRGASRAYDQVNVFDNNRTWQQRTPTTQRSNIEQVTRPVVRAVQPLSAGYQRQVAGLGETASGFVDLVTPGKGTSQITKNFRTAGELKDIEAKNKQYNPFLYKAGQFGGEVAQIAATGGLANVATKAPVVAKAATVLPRIAPRGASVAAKTGRFLARPDIASNVVANVAQGSGYRTARDIKNTPLGVATDVGISLALPAAASVGAQGIQKGFKVAKSKLPKVYAYDSPKPKAPQVGKTDVTPGQIKAAQKQTLKSIAEKPKVSIKEPVIPTRTTDDSLREISKLSGEEIGDSKVGLGLQNQLMSAATGGKVKNLRKANFIRTIADATGEKINKATEANITGSGAPVANKARALFAGTGLTDETKQISRVRHGKLANIKDVVERVNKKDTDIQAKYGPEAQDMLDRVMRDEAYTYKVYGEAPRDISTLPKELQDRIAVKTAQNKIINDINLQTGVIDEATWAKGAEGEHIGRIFAIPKQEDKFNREALTSMFESNASIKRKDISKMVDETIELLERDPFRAMNLRMEMALRNQALTEAMQDYASRGFIKKTKPNDNFIQMNGKRYGRFDGQYVERGILEELTGNRIFESSMAESFDKLINSYKGSALGVSDRLQKAFKTTMSPGTIIGNVSSNPLIFNPGAGTNPLTQVYDMLGAARKLSKGVSDADVFKARQLGVVGGDTGKLLTGSSSEQMAMQAKKMNIPKRVLSKFGQFYGNIDDTAKMGLWMRLQKQGLDPQKAAIEVAKFTQDYNNVGRVITLIADTPVLGKPFARFSPELVRIIKNNATRAPHRILAGVAGLAYITNKLSQESGETFTDEQAKEKLISEGTESPTQEQIDKVKEQGNEERKARESAVGQTLIPGTAWLNELMGGPNTDVSLNIPVGDSAINVSRAMGLNFPMEPGVDPGRAILEQLLPVEIPTRKNSLGEDVFDPTKVVTSMTLRPFVEQAFDQNFMGSRVSDPTNRAYDSQGQEMKFTDLPMSEQLKNRAKALATSLSPLGNEIDSINSALRDKPTVTGKKRTLPQALLRSVGIKADNNDAETRKERVEIAEYFDVTKNAEQNFLKNNKDLEQLYFDIFPKTKDRDTGKKISNQITPEKWTRVQSDSSGRMYDFMKQQALEKEKKGQPIDPIFKISGKDDLKQVLELRSKPTGEDIEMDNILEATQSWYRDFKKAESKYYEDSAKFYESIDLPDTENQRAKDYRNVKWPEQPTLVQQYYNLKQSDLEAAKDMFKTTNLSEEFDKHQLDKLKYYNAKRKIEGVPPLSATTFDNVTFGYEEDESKVFNELKYGKGYGGSGYGSGGSKKDTPTAAYTKVPQAGNLQKVAIKSSAPEIRTKKSVKRRARPKLQLKKSMV